MRAFSGYGEIRILVEASTESEWVAQALEDAGHEVIVADPNYGPMYGALRRRVKTDGRDVEALCEANRRGWYRARTSGLARATHAASAAGRAPATGGMRSGLIAQLRALLRQEGLRLPSGSDGGGRRAAGAHDGAAGAPGGAHPVLEALRRAVAG